MNSKSGQSGSPVGPAAPDTFHYRLRVRYSECDAQKVVFNVRYGEYVELATTEFVRACGLEGLMVHGPFDYQLVKQTIEWKLPARFDQVLDLSVQPIHLGNTSFHLGIDFRIAGKSDIIAHAETVYVLTDAATYEKTPLTDAIRGKLLAAARGQVTDYANSRPVERDGSRAS
ncbi:MAG TPA: thioesterase family protein [Pirellulales bacterium]|jgi:acyl-CoA thioester hydrolase